MRAAVVRLVSLRRARARNTAFLAEYALKRTSLLKVEESSRMVQVLIPTNHRNGNGGQRKH
eukprot:721665-Prorocentrum_lima.AAC.1